MILLALDPSTDVTGAAIFREGELVVYTSFDAFELTGQPRSRTRLIDRIERIAHTRAELGRWLGRMESAQGLTVTHVAYETQSRRGHASSEALVMAVGTYLTLSRLSRLPLVEIPRVAACGVVGAGGVYREPAGATVAEREAKRARLKAAVIREVNTRLGLELGADQDAEADAIAVGLAAVTRLETTKKGRRSC